MKNKSYWQQTCELPSFPKVNASINTDIVIIGGGITGLMCAYYLRNSGQKITLLEQQTLAHATSGHTTGKISFLHNTTYQFLEKYYGIDTAQLYLKSNIEAMHDIQSIIDNNFIDCEYQENDAYIYTRERSNIGRIQKEASTLKKLGVTVLENTLEDKTILVSVGVKKQAVFHPLKYLQAIILICEQAGVEIFEHSLAHSFVMKTDAISIQSNKHQIVANQIIFATRFPPTIFPSCYFLKLTQTKEFAWHSSKGPIIKDSFLCIDTPIESFRPTVNGLMHGGFQHEIGNEFSKTVKTQMQQKNTFWSAQDAKANRGIPYIGYFSRKHQNAFIACGFNKWGMTLSHVSARLISDLILERNNPYQFLYSIEKHNPVASMKDIGKLVKHSFQGMITNRFVFSTKKVEKGQGKVLRINGKLWAVYRDENNILHTISAYCKHLKCVVSFNDIEKTWDCPCHGSRYDIDGNIIEGPTLLPLEKKGKHEL